MTFNTRASLVLASIVLVFPSISFAKEVVGISESTFQQLNEGHCYYSQQSGAVRTDSGAYCDPLIAQLENAIVMRVESHGEQYWVNTADGLPVLNRYVSNGMYHSGNKLYWVQDGFKVHIPKHKAFRTLLQSAAQADSRVTPINNADFDRMMKSCEYYGAGDPVTDAPYQACVAEVAQGRATHAQLARSIVLKVQDAGKLFYIPEGTETNPLGIDKRVLHNEQQISLYKYLWLESDLIQADVIAAIPVQ